MPEKSITHLILAPEVFRAPGGIARVTRHYLQAIAETVAPEPVVLVVLNDTPITRDQVASCRATNAHAVGCSRSKWQFAKTVWQQLNGGNVHVTSTHIALAVLLPVFGWLGRRFTYDVVVHGIEVWQPLSGAQRRALNGARLILSVSEYTRQKLISRHPELALKTKVLPNALDPSFEPAPIDDTVRSSRSRILAVSRLAAHDWEKGIDHLIQAMPHVCSVIPEAELRIVGEGVDRVRLEKLAQKGSVKAHIKFLGYVKDAELRSELTACDLFALPSRKEGFGLVYLEAMAAGKPCIAANEGGAPEVVDSNSGLIVPYGNVTILGESIVVALKKAWTPVIIQTHAMEFSFPTFARGWRTLCLRAS